MAEGKKANYNKTATTSGAFGGYFLAMVGAAWFWVGQANGFGEVIVALLKALVWPAFFVYDVLKYIAA